jgi:Holliday junction resolvasome RuvABC endonuclease subunit
MAYILGLDQALTTGWAVVDDDGDIVGSGIHNFRPERGSSDGILYMAFSKWVEVSIRKVLDIMEAETGNEEVDILVVYELAHHRGNAATVMGMAFTTRIVEMCDKVGMYGYNIEYTGVRTNVLKKTMTGNGNAKKPAMVAAAQQYKPEVVDDNEADAILLAMYGYENYG